MKTKILIIKLGYSETLDSEIGRIPSLGDVLRTTPMLWALKEKYTDTHITWLVSHEAEPLLRGNRLIDRIFIWDEFIPFQLMREKFDVLINLEKISGVCALSDMIDAWTKYGFRFDSINGTYHGYERGMTFVDYIRGKRTNRKSRDCWQKILIEMLGVRWKGQEYIIGYKPKKKIKYDVGLNYRIGAKWPNKEMPMEHWRELEKRLVATGYSVSWQQGATDLYEYIDWISSCKIIISHDSLGIHIAFALNKKIIGLFGPFDPKEIFNYGTLTSVQPDRKCKAMPCGRTRCITGLDCMKNMDLDKIVENAKSLLRSPRKKEVIKSA